MALTSLNAKAILHTKLKAKISTRVMCPYAPHSGRTLRPLVCVCVCMFFTCSALVTIGQTSLKYFSRYLGNSVAKLLSSRRLD